MRRIFPLELVGQDKLVFDIYNNNGILLYKSGEALTPGILMQLCNINVFVKESVSEKNINSDLTNNKKLLKYKQVIPEHVAKTLINLSKNLFKEVYDNTKPDISACKEASEIIVEEVNNNIEKIECISQLKIFDEYIFSHTVNVSAMSSAIGMTLGMDENEVKELALSALLYDIGKILIPGDILNKPGKLEPEEFQTIKSHPQLGYKYILENTDLPDKIAKAALDHHENYGGGGYPNGLVGKEINLYAQITSIADSYDALTSNRVYQKAVDSDKAVEIMLAEAAVRFNPYILSKFMHLVDYKSKNDFNINNNGTI